MHELATSFVKRVCEHMKALDIDRLLPRHVSIVIFLMCQDPITRYTRHGLSMQTPRVKPLSKVFARVIQNTAAELEKEKYGLIDRKIVKGTQAIIEGCGLKSNATANVLIAACVAEMCGIMLNAARQRDKKTITLDVLQEASTIHVLSNGEACTNVSLVRFIASIKRPLFVQCNPSVAANAGSKRKRQTERMRVEKCPLTVPSDQCPVNFDGTARRDQAATRLGNRKRTLEEKSVKFTERPRTPDTCFWEEDE